MNSPPGGAPDAGSPGPDGPGDTTTYCYRHPSREALIRCTRCERPICPDCMRPASVGFHCPDDVALGAKSVRAPSTAVGARILQSRPYVTISLIALNVIAYLVTAFEPHGSLTNPTNSKLFIDWQLFPHTVHDDHEYYQLLTSTFLHLSPLHIIANMLVLALVGPAVEELLGRWRYLALYLLCGLAGSAAVYAFGDALGYTAGASGSIFGLFGASLVLVRKLGLDAQWLIGTIVINFVITFSVPHISQLGHVGGFVAGLLGGLAIGGSPTARVRVPTRVQAAGLGGLGVLVVLLVAIRTLTW